MAIKIQGETIINDDGSFQLSTGTTAQRPSSPTTGMYRFNTETSSYEIYNGTNWLNVATTSAEIATPSVSVTNSPSSVKENPTISTSAFSVTGGSSIHVSTDWEVRRTSDNGLVYSSYNNTSNKTSITVPLGNLQTSTEYYFRARHNGTNLATSEYGSTTATTRASFFPLLGESYCGGYYIGVISWFAGCYAMVAAPNFSGCTCTRYKNTNTSTTGACSFCDGCANTYVALNNSAHAAGQFAAGRIINGFSDWYLPSRCELGIMCTNQSSMPAGEGFAPAVYWSSTSNSTTTACAVAFGPATVFTNKTYFHRVRAIRRVPL